MWSSVLAKNCFLALGRKFPINRRTLATIGELLLTEARDVFNPISCFVLAPNKDLAVSFLHYCRTFPLLGMPTFRLSTFLFAPRTLLWTAVSRYYFNSLKRDVGVRTFLSSFRIKSNHSSCWDTLILPVYSQLSSFLEKCFGSFLLV